MDVREKTAELNYLKEEMAKQREENKYLREELKNKENELRYYFGFGDACRLIFGRRYENGC